MSVLLSIIALTLGVASVVVAATVNTTGKTGNMGETGPTGSFYGFVNGILPIAHGGTNSSAALVGGKLMRSTSDAIVEGTSATDPDFRTLQLTETGMQIKFGSNLLATTLNVETPSSNVTVTLPDPGADAEIVVTEGNQTINGEKTFTDDTNFSQNIVVTENVLIGGSAMVEQDLIVKSTFIATGTSYLNILNVTGIANFSDDVSIDGAIDVQGNATITGDSLLYGNLTVKQTTNIQGTVNVQGNATVTGDARVYGDLRVQGSTTITGDTSLYGNLVLAQGGSQQLRSQSAQASNGGIAFQGGNGNLIFVGGSSANTWGVYDRNSVNQFFVRNNNNGAGSVGSTVGTFNTTLDDGSGNLVMKNNSTLKFKDSIGASKNILTLDSGNTVKINGSSSSNQFYVCPDGTCSELVMMFNTTGPASLYYGANKVFQTDSGANMNVGSTSTTCGIRFLNSVASYVPEVMNYYEVYTGTVSWSGPTAAPLVRSVSATRTGKCVMVQVEGGSGTFNSSQVFSTSSLVPTRFGIPSYQLFLTVIVTDNGSEEFGSFSFSGGFASIGMGASGSAFSAGTIGWSSFSFSYFVP